MSAWSMRQDPPDILVEILDDLDAPTLRGVHEYVEAQLDELRPSLEELIRSEAAGEIVDIVDGGAYTLVKMYPPTGDDSRICSESLILYRVKHEKRMDGEEKLNWAYLGEISDWSGVEGGNGGSSPPSHDSSPPPCGTERPRDGER